MTTEPLVPPAKEPLDVVILPGRGALQDRAWQCTSAAEAARMLAWLSDGGISATRTSKQGITVMQRTHAKLQED